ncbi:HepT-like ribonuclease domain-containing protein [Parvicella tangerina]|uniref:DUF86 domain-containing protein n=1 Tax=Parvicella tangerina TaxID=2829795 RepID=A0A916JIS7_9FLAO|nr:HepT-like ribonuclease domain-containing protein [Parvicella tangerina]CAG5076705.1 hypothetical protein CRYO30217_00177 [Parvicella tangerina]
MENKIKTWLMDIQNAIEEINLFIPDKKDFFQFQNDLKTKRAIERNIEIIGEAMNRILTVDENFPIENARKIVDTRNRIIHGYDKVSEDIIWAIVVKDLPLLYGEVTELIKK